MHKRNRLIFGVGINDADYTLVHKEYINSKRVETWRCPYYIVWVSMLRRCYSDLVHKKEPSYKDCEVSENWEYFSKFKEWMEKQDWEGKQLDKDILKGGNKLYCEEYCVFIDQVVNNFITDSFRARGLYLLGTSLHKSIGKFQSNCGNSFTSKREYLGIFPTELEAHLTWKTRKYELAIQLANSEYVTDERVAQALINRYSGNGVYINAVLNNVPVEEFLQNREKYMQM